MLRYCNIDRVTFDGRARVYLAGEAEMRRTQVARVMLLAILSLLACDGQSTAPRELVLGSQRVHGLELNLTIDPITTVPGGALTATLTITNRRDRAVTLVSGCTQLARALVYRAGDVEPQWFIGATGGCYTALSSYQLDVGETFQQVWKATAASRVYLGDFQFEIIPASAGDYVFRVSPDVITIDRESARLPEMEVAFQVQ
jgi:hypothetical protein